MNQPAPKEPTMDEILSSIRQIIADDDEAAGKKNAPQASGGASVEDTPVARVVPEPKPEPAEVIDPFSDDEEEPVPLALSPDQIIADETSPDEEGESAAEPEIPPAGSTELASEASTLDDVASEPEDAPEAAPSQDNISHPGTSYVAQGAPMPDPELSSDMAEQLLEPATEAAVRSAFAKLDTPKLTPDMALGSSGMTIEAMIREMLRPMLKEWLEENLPSMVERIVAQEIERVCRGGK